MNELAFSAGSRDVRLYVKHYHTGGRQRLFFICCAILSISPAASRNLSAETNLKNVAAEYALPIKQQADRRFHIVRDDDESASLEDKQTTCCPTVTDY